MLHEPFGPHGAEEETEELWTDLSEVPETAYEQDPKHRINSDTDMPFDPSLLPTDVGRILRTFKIKKNVEVTDNGKIII